MAQKGQITSDETKAKMRSAALRNLDENGLPKGGRLFQKGHTVRPNCDTPEFRKKMSIIARSRIAKGIPMPTNWKGNEVSYAGIHKWISNHFNKDNTCDFCSTTDSKRFEWANKDGMYLRDRDNWYRLCVKCHRQFDKKDPKRAKMLSVRSI